MSVTEWTMCPCVLVLKRPNEDGFSERVRCEKQAGHAGKHSGNNGTYTWG